MFKKFFCLLLAIGLVVACVPSAGAQEMGQDLLAVPLGDSLSGEAEGEEPVQSDTSDQADITEGSGEDSSVDSADSTDSTPANPTDEESTDGEEEPLEEAEGSPDENGESTTEEELPVVSTELLAGAPAPGTYLLRSALTHVKVVDVAGGSRADGANIQLWASNMSSAQAFRISAPDSKGYITITNLASGKALDVAGAGKTAGTNVWQYASNGTAAQKWIAEQKSNGAYVFRSALNRNLVLDIHGGSTANGSNIRLWGANNSAAQQFYLMSTSPTVSTSKTLDTGVYLIQTSLNGTSSIDVSGASKENGVQMQIWGSNNTLAQKFKIEYKPSGYYSIRVLHSSKALDASSGNLVASTRVNQWAYSASNKNQEWAIRENGDGTYAFIARSSGLALDVTRGTAKNGTKLQLYYPNASSNAQKWKITKIDTSSIGEGIYTIGASVAPGKVVDIKNGSRSAGATTQIWAGNGSSAQKYQISKSGNAYTLRALCSGLYLTASGSKIVQQPSNGAASQQWLIELSFGGYVIKNMATGTVFDVSGAGTYNGCGVGLYGPNGTFAQSFSISRTALVSAGTYEIRSAIGDRAVDVAGGSSSNGANVQVYQANGTGAQKWTISEAGNGYYTIHNAKSRKAMDVRNKATTPGANVQQWSAVSGNVAQLWKPVSTGDGYFYLESACGGQYLTVAGAANRNGANIEVNAPANTAAQKFRLVVSSPSLTGDGWLDGQLATIASNHGNDLYSCFLYVSNFSYQTMDLYPQGNWAPPYAKEMLVNNGGNCYRYAALFCCLAWQLGYDANVVSGWTPGYAGGQEPHGWVEIYIDGVTYVCDPCLANSLRGYNWYMFTYHNAPASYNKW